MIFVQAANQISMQEPLCESWIEHPMVHDEPYCRSIDPDFKEYVSPAEGRRMSKLMKRALATSLKTLRDSGVVHPDAIITGTGLGSVESTEAFLLDMCQNGEQLLKPTHFMQSTHNTIGSLIAIQTKSHGYNATYSHKQISFDSALYDAWLQLKNEEIENALVLGQDATTPNYFHLLELADYVGNGMKGTCGEASMASLITRISQASNGRTPLCELSAIRLLHSPSDIELETALHQMSLPEDFVVLSGENGHPKNDCLYQSLLKKHFPGRISLQYKQWFGECFTSSALGFYVAAQWIGSGCQTNILLVNMDREGDVSFILLKKI